MVVRAIVHARLLGLRILSLDARVVVSKAPEAFTRVDLTDPVPARAWTLRSSARQASRSLHSDAASGQDLSHAVELLARGTETLERSRRSTETLSQG
jgi:hypothetical protein